MGQVKKKNRPWLFSPGQILKKKKNIWCQKWSPQCVVTLRKLMLNKSRAIIYTRLPDKAWKSGWNVCELPGYSWRSRVSYWRNGWENNTGLCTKPMAKYPFIRESAYTQKRCRENRWPFTFTFTFMHLADAFIQSDLHCIQVTVSTFYQVLLSLGIEPMILALLTPCSTSWATGMTRQQAKQRERKWVKGR